MLPESLSKEDELPFVFGSPGEADSFRQPEGKEVHSGSFIQEGLCGASLGSSPFLGRLRGSQTARCRRTQRGTKPHPLHPCTVPRPSTSHPEPAATRMCPHSLAMAAEEPESLVLQGRGRAWQPAAGRQPALGPAWATLVTQFLCTAPTVGGGGQRWGRGMESSPSRWRFSLPCVTAQEQGGLGKLAGTQRLGSTV